MTTLFICHASEDKDSFVRPLAEALKVDFQVWFDEYALHIGDSLRAKIDEGLNKCDFAVVVLSRAFFEKKWPQSELDGLFALETSHRKLILPVWHEVAQQDVAKFSPMLAGRLAASSSKGVSAVVEEIKRAISASERTREVAVVSTSKAAFRSIVETIVDRQWEQKFLWSTEGVAKIKQSANEIVSAMVSDVEAVTKETGANLFSCNLGSCPGQVSINGPCRVCLFTELTHISINSAEHTRFVAGILIKGTGPRVSREDGMVEQREWSPKCRKDRPVQWQAEDAQAPCEAAEIASILAVRLRAVIGERINEGSR
jgi:hypothetical protein